MTVSLTAAALQQEHINQMIHDFSPRQSSTGKVSLFFLSSVSTYVCVCVCLSV